MIKKAESKIAGVILAGGKSSRMGENKALLPWRGGRLIDYVAGVLRNAGITDIYVSGEIVGYTNIPDSLPHQGPVGGICASIEFLQDKYEKIIFVPVDMPLLTVPCLKELISQKKSAFFTNNPLPCFLYFPPFPSEKSGTKEISVKKYLSDLGASEIALSTDFAKAITNTNTMEEWKAATYECSNQ
jgi:molybdopterin-guanine dinucleotide biosynthesis protein A